MYGGHRAPEACPLQQIAKPLQGLFLWPSDPPSSTGCRKIQASEVNEDTGIKESTITNYHTQELKII
jgi:hypothetical protein